MTAKVYTPHAKNCTHPDFQAAKSTAESVADSDCIEGRLVEPDGIEPTTSCLQSTRSPS